MDTVKSPKPFKIYISGFCHIKISRDVTFNEETTLNKSRRCHLEEVHEEYVRPINIKVEPPPEIVASKYRDMMEPQEPLLWIYLERENLLG